MLFVAHEHRRSVLRQSGERGSRKRGAAAFKHQRADVLDGHGVALVRFHNKLFAARADVRGVADDHASVGHNRLLF